MKNSGTGFYEFLVANSKLTENTEKKKPNSFYVTLSWIIIFLVNSTILYFGWNYGLSAVFELSTITFFESIMVYSSIKVLSRGFFSTQ